jgi:hypothetical protein
MSDMKRVLCQQFAVSDVDYEKALSYQNKYNGRIEQVIWVHYQRRNYRNFFNSF